MVIYFLTNPGQLYCIQFLRNFLLLPYSHKYTCMQQLNKKRAHKVSCLYVWNTISIEMFNIGKVSCCIESSVQKVGL